MPKASKSEKNRGCETLDEKHAQSLQFNMDDSFENRRSNNVMHHNYHPTCKPIKLISWLLILGSREGDTIMDPFLGSGTTALAAKMNNRYYVGIEIEKEYYDIASARIDEVQQSMDRFL